MTLDWQRATEVAQSITAQWQGEGQPGGAIALFDIAKRHYFDNSQLCFFATYQGSGCNHF